MRGNPEPVDPARLTVVQTAKVLSAAFRERIPAEQIEADIDAGAPTNSDGTINLVNYTAWQLQEVGRGND